MMEIQGYFSAGTRSPAASSGRLRQLISEVHRRRLWQVLADYLGAWAGYEVAPAKFRA